MNPADFSTLDDWLNWLETLSPREIVLGLERVQAVLGRLDVPPPPTVIHVAGTNGKGSSVAMLEALLRHDGVGTGCYTSPHIVQYNERIRIDGESASDAAIIAAFEIVEAARQDVPLTYFEFGTLAALVAFDAAGVDAWLLEVGMGGRLDAVNAVEPDASLITNISLDHCDWLGADIESIAREKAGIMRPSKPVVFGASPLPAAIRTAARASGAHLLQAGQDFAFEHDATNPTRWNWRGVTHELQGLGPLSLQGEAQLQNASAVLAVVEALGMDRLLTENLISESLAEISLGGRFQVIDRQCRWILDVAHNPDAARVLARLLLQEHGNARISVVIGMLADKDIKGFVAPLCPLIDRWIAVTVRGARAAAAAALAQQIAQACDKPCLVADDVADALELAAESAGREDIILVTGSFYSVGSALEWLRDN